MMWKSHWRENLMTQEILGLYMPTLWPCPLFSCPNSLACKDPGVQGPGRVRTRVCEDPGHRNHVYSPFVVQLHTSVNLLRRAADRGAPEWRDRPGVRKWHLPFTINYQTALWTKSMAVAWGQPSEVSGCKSSQSCTSCWLGPGRPSRWV